MWTRIGLATARRQLRVGGGAALISCVARGPATAYSGVIFRRAFTVSRLRAVAAAVKAKSTTTTRKAAKTTAKPKKKASAAKPKAKKTTKKAAAKKTVPKKKKTKKVLTDEEKQKLLVKELRKKAQLGAEPQKAPVRIYNLFVREATALNGLNGPEKFASAHKAFKELPASELERLKSTVEANKLENAAALKAWILARSPAEIREINNARHYLNRLKVYKRRIPVLRDDRVPKMPLSAYLLFSASFMRNQTGVGASVASTEVAERWKKMSDAERQPYIDNSAVDRERYAQEIKAVFGQ